MDRDGWTRSRPLTVRPFPAGQPSPRRSKHGLPSQAPLRASCRRERRAGEPSCRNKREGQTPLRTPRSRLNVLVRLVDLAVVHNALEGVIDGIAVHAQTVGCQVGTANDARGQIVHEGVGVRLVPVAHDPRQNRLGLPVNGVPRPHVPGGIRCGLRTGQSLGLAVIEAPNLVRLDFTHKQAAHGPIVVVEADTPHIREKAKNARLGNAGHADGRVDRAALDKGLDDLDSGLGGEALHGNSIPIKRVCVNALDNGIFMGIFTAWA